jgi:hypothetical protein
VLGQSLAVSDAHLSTEGEQFTVGYGEGGLQLGNLLAVFAAVGGQLLSEAADQRAGGGLDVGGVSGVARDGIASCPAEGLHLWA